LGKPMPADKAKRPGKNRPRGKRTRKPSAPFLSIPPTPSTSTTLTAGYWKPTGPPPK